VAPSVLNRLANQLRAYPATTVLQGSIAYLERGCATAGKRESYLVGIIRGIHRQNGQVAASDETTYADWPHLYDCTVCGGAHETPTCSKLGARA